jgi:hypothetical protein
VIVAGAKLQPVPIDPQIQHIVTMTTFFARRKAQKAVLEKGQNNMKPGTIRSLQIFETNYTSAPVEIPQTFLSYKDKEKKPSVTYDKINWSTSPLPEYSGLYAAVLDNVLSQAECDVLLGLVEQSAGGNTEGVTNSGWKPAMVNAGANREFLSTEYRNSDRIIWDHKEIVERLWERCLLAPGLKDDIAIVEGNERMLGASAVAAGQRWKVERLNERMRFLKYGKGQFFKEHCDGSYSTPDGNGKSFYTLHLYLNDSAQEIEKEKVEKDESNVGTGNGEELKTTKVEHSDSGMLRGGATTFHSFDMARRMDVDPKAGRVLIFQHKGLLHSGDNVIDGIKYTLRTDIMYGRDVI